MSLEKQTWEDLKVSPYQDFNRARKQRVVSFPRRKPNIAEAPQHGLARWSERLGAAWPAQSRKTVLILKHEMYLQGNQESLLWYPLKCRLGTKRSYSKKKKKSNKKVESGVRPRYSLTTIQNLQKWRRGHKRSAHEKRENSLPFKFGWNCVLIQRENQNGKYLSSVQYEQTCRPRCIYLGGIFAVYARYSPQTKEKGKKKIERKAI